MATNPPPIAILIFNTSFAVTTFVLGTIFKKSVPGFPIQKVTLH